MCVVDKKLTMPAYCVAANCNNSQTTPGITTHELPCNRPAVRWKWINLYNSNDLTFLLRHIMPICVLSTLVSAISQTPWNTGTLSKSCLAPADTAVSSLVSRAKYQFRLQSSSWPFCSDSPEWCNRHMVMWFGSCGDAFGTTENAFFSCIYNPQITVSPTSSFSVSFNGNRIKNHP